MSKRILFIILALLSMSCAHRAGDTISPSDNAKYFKIVSCERISLDTQPENQFQEQTQGSHDPSSAEVVDSTQDLAIITIDPSTGRQDTLTITEPMDNIVCMSASYVAYLSALGCDSVVTGVSGGKYISRLTVRERYEKGLVKEVGYDSAPDYEQIVALKPDLVVTYSLPGTDAKPVEKLRSLGVKVLQLNDFLENSPLARAEYVRLFGALTGLLPQADSIFAEVSASYNALSEVVREEADVRSPSGRKEKSGSDTKQRDDNPSSVIGMESGRLLSENGRGEQVEEDSQKPDFTKKVLINIPYADAWYIPGQDNYMSRLVHDAGGEILGAQPGQSESSIISVEQAYSYAQQADIWLNPGWCSTKADLMNEHPLFKSFGIDIIYNNIRRTNSGGGNDFWESGAVRPDLILRDLIRILHPEISFQGIRLSKETEPLVRKKTSSVPPSEFVTASDSLYFYIKVD